MCSTNQVDHVLFEVNDFARHVKSNFITNFPLLILGRLGGRLLTQHSHIASVFLKHVKVDWIESFVIFDVLKIEQEWAPTYQAASDSEPELPLPSQQELAEVHGFMLQTNWMMSNIFPIFQWILVVPKFEIWHIWVHIRDVSIRDVELSFQTLYNYNQLYWNVMKCLWVPELKILGRFPAIVHSHSVPGDECTSQGGIWTWCPKCPMTCLFWMKMVPWLYIVMLGTGDSYKVINTVRCMYIYIILYYNYIDIFIHICHMGLYFFLRAQLQVRLGRSTLAKHGPKHTPKQSN